MPSYEFSYVGFILVFSIIILSYLSLRVKSVLSEERNANEIIQGMLTEIGRRMKQQDMRILDQQIRLDIIDVKRNNLSVARTMDKQHISSVVYNNDLKKQIDSPSKSRDVTDTELSILKLLVDGVKSPIEIQKIVGLSREHVSRIMKEIYFKGLVSRETSERPYRYRLTNSGESVIAINA